jgi:hypothetical protein
MNQAREWAHAGEAAQGCAALAREAFSGFAKEGGRVGSGSLGSGTGGVARCAG